MWSTPLRKEVRLGMFETLMEVLGALVSLLAGGFIMVK
jgi:hypothetical protein